MLDYSLFKPFQISKLKVMVEWKIWKVYEKLCKKIGV